MSEDSKKHIIAGAASLMAKPHLEDRKPFVPSPLSASASPVPPATKEVIVKSADTSPYMQKEAFDITVLAFERHNIEKDVAETIKKEFDKRHRFFFYWFFIGYLIEGDKGE
ncbi:hypothetical protein RYX36_033312 [Vicia faba]